MVAQRLSSGVHVSEGLLMLKRGTRVGFPWESYCFWKSITTFVVKIIPGNSLLPAVGRITAPPKCSGSNLKNV